MFSHRTQLRKESAQEAQRNLKYDKSKQLGLSGEINLSFPFLG